MKKVYFLGVDWFGSNDGAWINALRMSNYIVKTVSHEKFLPNGKGNLFRVFSKTVRSIFFKQYNKAVLEELRKFKPDLIFVFKGQFLYPETVERLSRLSIPTILIFPDTSIYEHGPFISKSFKYYTHVFSTKKFHLKELADKKGPSSKLNYLPHGFDLRVHRNLNLPKTIQTSFVGTFSSYKGEVLSNLIKNKIDLKVFGNSWSKWSIKNRFNVELARYGDEYAEIICSSKINLALLYEGGSKSIAGDAITSRTFHIPAACGFMLHQRSEELLNYFEEGKEIECFNGNEELLDKIKFYLENTNSREKIAKNGWLRANNEHGVHHRLRKLINYLN
ncbi:glycosyltransferase [Verrucomicrobiales bacterium]|nr:glycosyltransferase [Verrucomicrobiales bacterium]